MKPAELADLLRRSCDGERHAFMVFYDQTVATASHLALLLAHRDAPRRAPRKTRADRSRGAETRATRAQHRIVRVAYREAWRQACSHPASGLPPVPWLLTLVTEAAGTTPAAARRARGRGNARLH